MTERQHTEQQIFEAASRVFRRKGYAGARMQQIADEADINKSMLHYYFRSKDKLFQKVFQAEINRFFLVVFSILDSQNPLEEKIERLIDAYYALLQDNTQIGHFIIAEMNQHSGQFRDYITQMDIHPPENFYKQIRDGIKNGNIRPVRPEQLMINIIALVLFPFISQTMINSIFKIEGKDYLNFLRERKKFLVEFILNGIKYQRK